MDGNKIVFLNGELGIINRIQDPQQYFQIKKVGICYHCGKSYNLDKYKCLFGEQNGNNE